MFGGNEIDRGEVTRFLNRLTAIAYRHELAIVLLHHESKSNADTDTHGASGSTAWINSARSALKITSEGESDLRTIKHIKSNYGKRQPDIPCKIINGAFLALGGDRERQALCLAAARDALTSALQRGERLAPSIQAKNHAGKFLVNQNPAFSETEYATAMDTLVADNLIEVENYRSGGKRCQRYALTADGCGTHTVRTVPVRFEHEPSTCKKRPKIRGKSKADGSSVRTVQ
jgi:RecA-family ATPase